MRLLRSFRPVIAAAVFVAVACAGSSFGREADPLRRVGLPFSDISVDEGFRVTEGSRGLGDLFPYLGYASETTSSMRYEDIYTANVGTLLSASPQAGGSHPAAIRTGAGAIEAVRLFLSGPIVTTPEAAERIVATARRLKSEFKHLSLEVNDHRPATYRPTATPLPQDRSMHPIEAWAVSLVALEVSRYLQLVHVEARVTAGGKIEITKKPIVDGPMTSWQTAVIGEYTEEHERSDREMHAEAVRARREYAAALRATRDLDTMWVLARVFRSHEEVSEFVGKADLVSEDGMEHAFRLTDGTFVWFIRDARKLSDAFQAEAGSDGRPGKRLLTICR